MKTFLETLLRLRPSEVFDIRPEAIAQGGQTFGGITTTLEQKQQQQRGRPQGRGRTTKCLYSRAFVKYHKLRWIKIDQKLIVIREI